MHFNPIYTRITAAQHRFRFLGLSTGSLLVALHPDVPLAVRTLCIFLHFALILMWQPLWHNTTGLSIRTATTLVICVTGLLLWPGWLIITVWVLIIIGLLGGEPPGDRSNQLIRTLAMACLFITLLFNLVPLLFEVSVGSDPGEQFAFYAALIPAAIIIILPASPERPTVQQIDYLRALSFTVLALLLLSGTVLWMYRAGISYTEALAQSMLFVAVLILAANWLWSNRSGYSIIQTLWNRYLLNLGSPFEQYLIFLSSSAREHKSPNSFLEAALDKLLELEWVVGVDWGTEGYSIQLGESTREQVRVDSNDVRAVIYSHRKLAPAFILHVQLLIHLIEHFYSSLQHEVALETHLRMEAVHQTGSRLTHDIKNLLQSMHHLTAVVEATSTDRAAESLLLLQRQFPELRQRMQLTLEKLKVPEAEESEKTNADSWWKQLQTRYASSDILFGPAPPNDREIPFELFDNVAENLIENARYKQKLDKKVQISARISVENSGVSLNVEDTGAPIEQDVADRLFTSTIPSAQGLGVGLYQSAQLAKRNGYKLHISSNEKNCVAISLTPNSPG